MDFEQLLSMAEESHEKTSTRPNQFKSTQVAAAKKNPKEKKLSDNVKKFLDRRKADEDTKRKDAEKKRNELQKLRAESRESQKVVKRMVTKNKGANFSVLQEAVNDRDTAHTLAGRHQCDEDDYGFESKMARNLYEKLMNKYESCPDDPMAKFTKSQPKSAVKDAKSTIARVKEALLKGDEPLPKFTDKNKRKARVKDEDDFINDGPIIVGESVRRKQSPDDKKLNKDHVRFQEEERKKKKRPQEASSFEDLLKLASKVKTVQPILQPIPSGSQEKVSKNEKVKELETRPMTKKQREEFERQKQSELRKSGKVETQKKIPNIDKIPSTKKSSNPYNMETNKANKLTVPNTQNYSSKAGLTHNRQNSPSSKSNVPSNGQNVVSNKYSLKHPSKSNLTNGHNNWKTSLDKRKQENNNGTPTTHNNQIRNSSKQKEHSKLSSKPSSSTWHKPESVINKIKGVEARHFPGEKQSSKNYNKTKRPRSRSRSRSPVPHKSQKSSGMRIESESEYDSEMDDFIDDSDAKVDISAEIRNIFGYDKRRFKDEEDFDDRSMETNRFSDVMKEEARSAKIGKMEDLEDMRREEEEKKRKMMRKKHRR